MKKKRPYLDSNHPRRCVGAAHDLRLRVLLHLLGLVADEDVEDGRGAGESGDLRIDQPLESNIGRQAGNIYIKETFARTNDQSQLYVI